jgi:hypothetical protein
MCAALIGEESFSLWDYLLKGALALHNSKPNFSRRKIMAKKSLMIRLISLSQILLLIGFSFPALAQQFTGTIRGTILDSAGAVVVGAEISIIHTGTNETRTVMSGDDGSYVVPQLTPGLYRIVVKKSGFKAATIDEIKLDVQQIRGLEVTLEVGATTETVLVTASGGATIETTSSTVSQTIENKRVADLPLNGRNPFSLATLSAGVIPAPGSSPFISGGRNATSEVTIDGVSNVNAENNVSILDLNYTPSVDAVQEFSVQTNAVSAEFGRLGGGVINLVTKSGTNQYHATVFEFHRNSRFDATNFFTNRAGQKKGDFNRNQFGGNFGGPLSLPGYKGKDRTFFFFNYEGLRQKAASVSTFTVPLPEWRNGDFSNLRNSSGQLITIYDPLTTRPDPNNPGQFIRDPFPGNKIPINRLSAVGRNLANFWPLPNTTPTNAFTQANNYTLSGTSPANGDRIDSRVDHIFNNKWRMFVRYSWSDEENLPFNSFGNPASSSGGDGPTFTTTHSLAIDHTLALSPTLVVDLRYGLNRRLVNRLPLSAGFDLASLGFPSNVVSTAQAKEFPRVDVQGFQSLGQNTFTDLIIAPTTHTFSAGTTKILSNHTVKFGMDYRKYMLNFLQLFFPAGQYGFSNAQWTQRNPNVSSGTEGFAVASMLLGIPSFGQMSHNPTPASASSYWAFYVQDDWKVSRKLTLNFGLRYDFEVPRTERFNRLSSFDFDAVSPIADKVPANPFFNPADLRGALVFTDEDNRRQVPTDRNNFGPRFGFAYNVTEKTVVRGAYGIYFMPSYVQAAGHSGSAGMMGFNSQSNMIVSIDSNRTPRNFIDNPFPDGFNLPPGNSLGASTFIGLGIGGGNGGVFTDFGTPYVQQWNLNIQRELPGNFIAEIAYIGSKGTRLLIGESGFSLSQLPESFLSLGTALQDQVPNPFFGIITNPSSPLRFPTVERRRLLRPFPQYDGVGAFRVPGADSIYNAMTLRVDKRFSNGISLLSSYTWGKLIDTASTTVGFLGQAGVQQNAYDKKSDRSISSQDIGQRFVTAFVYDLPFGKGKAFGESWNGPLNWVLGGWQLNGIVAIQDGLPLLFSQSQNNTNLFNPSQRPNWTGRDASLNGSRDEKIRAWFDKSQFSTTPAFRFGNAPRVMPNLRADGTKNVDLSLFKNNYFNEGKWNAQLRVEFFNAFNRTQFGNPNTQVDSGNFGIVSGQANSPRQIQLALKLLF